MRIPRQLTAALWLVLSLSAAEAGEVSVAVAANFTAPAEAIGAAFAVRTGHEAIFSFGATGGLYAQITQGAPFEVFLAADGERPRRAVAEGLGVAGTVFTYAVGRLVLYGPGIDLGDGESVLRSGGFSHIAIADPETAPYGAAALAVIDRLGIAAELAPRQVIGQNVGQALQFVDSGNAELGFVALSQVTGKPAKQVWRVPDDYYPAILQDAVLLAAGEANGAARSFIDFLRSDEAQAIIRRYGYATVP